MINLYHSVSARSLRPLWALEELELPYRLHMLPFPPRVSAPEFLERNPLGTVPLLEDGTLRMTESTAMCEYLARTYGNGKLSISHKDSAYGDYLNWLFMSDATLTFPQTLVLRYGRFEPPERQHPQLVDDYSRWFLSRMKAVDNQLAHHAYLCADRFTLADIAVGYALLLAELIGLAEHFKPHTRDYLQRLKARPALQRALHAQKQAALDQGISPAPATELDFSTLHPVPSGPQNS